MTYRVLSAVVCAVFLAAPLAAQQPFPTSAPAGQKTGAGTAGAGQAGQQAPVRSDVTQNYRLALDEFLVLVPFRAEDDIQADIDASRLQERRALEEKRSTEDLERLARDQLEAQKAEIDAIKARLKVAKNDDRKAEEVVLESDQKLAEGAKELLEKRRDLRKEEAKGWDMVSKLAAATRQAAELELELASARNQLREAGPQRGTEELNRLERRVNELEKRTLEAQKKRADLRAKVAQTERDVVENRLDLLKTRIKINAGG